MSLRLEPDRRARTGPRIALPESTLDAPEDLDLTLTEWPSAAAPTDAIRVIAVLVAHDGAEFLPRTLDALDAQSRRPDRLVAVDVGSRDGGGDLLGLATGCLLRLNRETSFGDAVQAALTALDATELEPAADPRPMALASAAPVPGPGSAGSAVGPSGSLRTTPSAGTDWLWLLHDDSAPAPEALRLLIEAVDGGPSIGIAGCKQVSWDDAGRLLDVGFTVSRFGARVTGVDIDDVDQGQLDHRTDVLAVGTAGMLVRRDVWDLLGGCDPALTHAREDLDLCVRAHRARLRVVVVPQAVIAHAAATQSGRRTAPGSASWALRDRRAAVHLRLASIPLVLLPFLLVWLTLAAGVRAVGRLILAQPDRAGAELAAYGLTLSRPSAWVRARQRLRADRGLPRRDFRRLLAGSKPTLRQHRDAISAYLRTQEEAWAGVATAGPIGADPAHGPAASGPAASGPPVSGPAASGLAVSGLAAADAIAAGLVDFGPAASGPAAFGPAASGPGGSDSGPAASGLTRSDSGAARGGAAGAGLGPGEMAGPSQSATTDSVGFGDEREPARRPALTRIGLAVAGVAGLAGLAGLRLLLSGTGVPVGPGLLPAPETAGELWSQALSGWRPGGLGQAGPADPFDLVLAVISWPLAGSTRVGAELILLGALPLAALSAWWSAAGATGSRALRAWAALAWAAAPALLSAVAAGRLGAVVAHVLLPPAALALARTIGARPTPNPENRLSAAESAIRARGSIAAASMAGLLISLLIAAAPVLAVPTVITLAIVAAVARSGRRRLIWVAFLPAVLLSPWWVAVARDPGLLLAEPGGASALESGAPGWAAVLWPADPAAVGSGPMRQVAEYVSDLTTVADASFWLRAGAIAVLVPLLLLGLSALASGRRTRPVAVFWAAGLSGLVVAVLTPLLTVRAGAQGELRGWPGAAVSALTLAVLAAALIGLDGAAGRLRNRSLGSLHWFAVGAGVVAVLTPLILLGGWSVTGWSASSRNWVHRASPDILPAVAAAEAESPAATRTLVLRFTPKSSRWTILRTVGPGSARTRPRPSPSRRPITTPRTGPCST